MPHAKWSPSGASKWMECFASMAEELAYVRVGSSIFADEGTAAHRVLEWALSWSPEHRAADFPHKTITVETTDEATGEVLMTNIIEVDDDMREYVQTVVDDVMAAVAGGWSLYVEQRVGFSETIKAYPDFIKDFGEQFGTSDIILVSPDGTHCIVADLKYGKGVKVYATENHQMLCYAVGVLETFDGLLGDFEKFTLRVYQPRIEGGWRDEWECTRAKVAEHGQKMRIAAENNISAMRWIAAGKKIPDSFYKPGEKTCMWCKAKAGCKKLEEKVQREVLDDFQDLDATNEQRHEQIMVFGTQMPKADRLGQAFANLEMIEAWCKAVRAECERQVLGGMTVIGVDGLALKLIEGRKGNRAYADKDAAAGLIVGAIGDEAYERPEIISPAAAEKKLKRQHPDTWEALQAYISQAPGKPKVVEGNAEGKPYTGTASDAEFADLSTQEAA